MSGKEAGLSLLVGLAWTIATSSQAKPSLCSKFLSLQYTLPVTTSVTLEKASQSLRCPTSCPSVAPMAAG